ncbi:MAG: hypothetical protein HUJ54_07360 [Erysipelotrichaceae bacterium]|nr:hypothetical protein [Erysipelotrichaceae bacterium]
MKHLPKLFAAGLIASTLLTGCGMFGGGDSTANTAKTDASTDTFKQKQAEAKEKQKQNEEAKAKRESSSSSGTSSDKSSSSSSGSTAGSGTAPGSTYSGNTYSGSTNNGTAYSGSGSEPVYRQQPNTNANTYAYIPSYYTADDDAAEDLSADTFMSKKNLDEAMDLWVNSGTGNFCTYVIKRDADGNDVYYLTRSSKEEDPEGYLAVTGQTENDDSKKDDEKKVSEKKSDDQKEAAEKAD